MQCTKVFYSDLIPTFSKGEGHQHTAPAYLEFTIILESTYSVEYRNEDEVEVN